MVGCYRSVSTAADRCCGNGVWHLVGSYIINQNNLRGAVYSFVFFFFSFFFLRITAQLMSNYASYVSHLVAREPKPGWIGFNADPRPAPLRPTKYHNET